MQENQHELAGDALERENQDLLVKDRSLFALRFQGSVCPDVTEQH